MRRAIALVHGRSSHKVLHLVDLLATDTAMKCLKYACPIYQVQQQVFVDDDDVVWDDIRQFRARRPSVLGKPVLFPDRK